MLLTNLIMIALLYYQVTMPAVDNAKFTATVYNGQLVRMNSQNGEFEICDKDLKCEKTPGIK